MTAYRGVITMLAVADMRRSLDFYERALGFKVRSTFGEPAHWCMLECGELRLMLDRRGPKDLTPAADHAKTQFASYYYPRDLHALHRHITSLGYQAPAPAVTPYGMLEFRMQDPDGYWLWFGHIPEDSNLFSETSA